MGSIGLYKNQVTSIKNLFYLVIALSAFMVNSTAAQNTNPFELQYRQKVADPKANYKNPFDKSFGSSDPAPPTVTNSRNPFDLNVNSREKAQLDSESVTSSKPTGANQQTTFLLLLITTLLSAVLISSTRPILSKVFRSFMNANFLELTHRDEKTIPRPGYLLLYIHFFLALSLFIYLLALRLAFIPKNDLFLLLKIFTGTLIVFIAKHLLLSLLIYTYEAKKELRQYSFMIMIFGIVLGVILVPVNVMLAFGQAWLIKILIILVSALIGIIYLYRSMRGLMIGRKYIFKQGFHFFMYFCTVEIAPFVVLVKLILLRIGVQ